MTNDIAAIAQLFPRAFTAERWLPHKPLKLGIHADLIAAGILTPREVRNALAAYTKHRMYLAAIAAGGVRYDLSGNQAGEVTAAEAVHARESLASIDATAKDMAIHAKAAVAAARAARRREAPPPPPREPPQAKATPVVRGDTLTELRAAAAARRAAATTDAQNAA